MRSRCLAVSLWALALSIGLSRGTSLAQVTLGNTVFTGMSQNFLGIGVEFFGGLPFAEPPVGSLRFMPPVPVNAINATSFDATQFGPACAQQKNTVQGPSSEDCLTLNVFRPAGITETAELPVMVWIYGGGFVEGQTSIYNATEMIVQSVVRGTPVVYVSINYRLGPLGFPQGVEAAQRGLLNLGLKDQLVGLQWVQNHISAFGGDPRKVTIFGESAGAISIADLFLSSGLEKLVRGAIFESGSASTLPVFNASQRAPAWDTFAANLIECNDTIALGISIPCAQNASLDDVLSAWAVANTLIPGEFLFAPVIDGPGGIIPDLPSKLLSQGKFSKIPFISGTNLDEGTLFTPQNLNTTSDLLLFIDASDQPFSTHLSAAFQGDIQKLLQLYPDDPALGSPFGTGNNTFGAGAEYKRAAAILDDVAFQSTRRMWIQAASNAGVKTFGYLFTDQNAALANPSLGVSHGSEITYVYGLQAINSTKPEVQLLSTAMVDYWLSFIVSQTPNDGKGIPKTVWPQYTPTNQKIIQLDTTAFFLPLIGNFAIIPDTYRAEQIAFINSVAADLAE